MPPTIASPRAFGADLAISWRNEKDRTQVEPLAGYLRSRGGVSSVAIDDDIKQGRELDHSLGVVPTHSETVGERPVFTAQPYRSDALDCFLAFCTAACRRMSLVRLQQVSITTTAKFWQLGAVMDLSRCRVFFSKDRLAFSPSRQS